MIAIHRSHARAAPDASRGIRALEISLAGLPATAPVRAVVVAPGGSRRPGPLRRRPDLAGGRGRLADITPGILGILRDVSRAVLARFRAAIDPAPPRPPGDSRFAKSAGGARSAWKSRDAGSPTRTSRHRPQHDD